MKHAPPDLVRCPSCESNDVTREEVEDRWFRRSVRYQCRACGRVFRRPAPDNGKPAAPAAVSSAPLNDDPARCVEYPVLRCPHCQSKDISTHTTRPPAADGARARYHKCRACQHDFSSLETG